MTTIQPIITSDPLSNRYYVVIGWVYEIDNIPVTIPTGFCTDGASIPRFLWSLIGSPYQPQFIAAAILHDYLYYSGIVSRKVADRVFRDMLISNGVSKKKAKAMYAGVRSVGWIPYRNYRKARKNAKN